MSEKLWRLTVRSEFSSAHALRHYRGKCENIHGHNYGVEVTIEGRTLSPDTELVMDFSDLKNLLKNVLDNLDHQLLNQVPPFDIHNPSSENLSRYIWQRMQPGLPEDVHLYAVTVSEKAAQSATYMEIRPAFQDNV